jgi:hypothetical protein
MQLLHQQVRGIVHNPGMQIVQVNPSVQVEQIKCKFLASDYFLTLAMSIMGIQLKGHVFHTKGLLRSHHEPEE